MSRSTIDHFFNVFGYFGNVARIKMMPSRGLVLVDFATPAEANNAIRFLRNVVLFGRHLQCVFARYPTLTVPPGVATDTMHDYTVNARIHRYPQGIESERVRWIIPPSNRLHVILTGHPPDDVISVLRPLFERAGRIAEFCLEPGKGGPGGGRNSMSLVEFETVEAATDCLAMYHNYEMGAGKLFMSFTNKRLR